MASPRLLSLLALDEVFSLRSKPREALEKFSPGLDRRDRAFLMEITYGVLRYRDTLDWILNVFLKKPGRLSPYTTNNLRSALYQILFMRVPDWAVVNESVAIEKEARVPDGRRRSVPELVNAVLRNVLREKDRFSLPLTISDPSLNIAVNTSHPRWLVKRWIQRFGPEEAMSLARSNNHVPPLTIRVNTLRTARSELLSLLSERGIEAEPTRHSPDGITLLGLHTYEELSFMKGLFFVQDEASQLISIHLNPVPGERILDACAAPGGKTTHIAQIMNDSGEVVAVEKDERRTEMLLRNIEDAGVTSVRVITGAIADAGDIGTFDRILVDAPCSSLGVIRRNPDVKYRHRPGDLRRLAGIQLSILLSASRLLKKNGTIAYSVCSTEPEEGEDVIASFLKMEKDFRIIDAVPRITGSFCHDGYFRTFPHRDAMDGFFGVMLCRESSIR